MLREVPIDEMDLPQGPEDVVDEEPAPDDEDGTIATASVPGVGTE